jgi:hypothetical protein
MKDFEQNDAKLEKDIKESLDFLDGEIKVKVPDINAFRAMVTQVEEKKQEKTNRETVLFLASALVILFVEIYSFNRSFTAFVIVQILSLLCLPVTLLVWRRQKKRQVIS